MTFTNHNLETFKTLFIIKGILTFLLSFVFAAYTVLGSLFMDIFMNFVEFSLLESDFPFDLSFIFIAIGTLGFVSCFLLGILTLLAAKYMKHRKNHNFIFVVSILNCFTGILGILLGVFTIVEINKPAVKELFKKRL